MSNAYTVERLRLIEDDKSRMVLQARGNDADKDSDHADADDAAGNTTKIRGNITIDDVAVEMTSCGEANKHPGSTSNRNAYVSLPLPLSSSLVLSSPQLSCRPPSSQQHPSRPPQPRTRQQQKSRRQSFLQHINQSSSRRSRILLRQSSQSFHSLVRKSSNLIDSINQHYLPSSPSGWSLFTLSLASLGLQYELHVQKTLTASPIVFCQTSSGSGQSSRSVLNTKMDRLFRMLSNNTSGVNNDDNVHPSTPPVENDSVNGGGILSRKVTPSLIIGTRGIMSSIAAYAFGDYEASLNSRGVKRVREVMKMGADGALIVLDWEIPINPPPLSSSSPDINFKHSAQSPKEPCSVTMPNSIDKPVVLLVHGMNNDSSFGYIRSMMRTATKRGWIAVCMNLRGQDGRHQVKNATPRGYNAGYTGDLRGVVQQIQHRLKRKEDGKSKRNQFNNTVMDDHDDDDMYIGGPIFLLGYSLGANIITKYLGEESLHGTLPKSIGGGAAMGNPLHINSGSIRFPWNMVLGAGVKKSILQNFSTYKRHHDPGFQSCFTKALFSSTIGELDDTVAPYIIRNDSHPPYTPRIGFKDGKEYWWDSSSHRYVAHVSVPLLKISAQDDFLVFGQFARKMNHCMENPNVLVVKTRCGGHLGWQESPPPSKNGKRTVSSLLRGSGSWSDVAVADFIEAVMQLRNEDRRMDRSERMQPPSPPRMLSKL